MISTKGRYSIRILLDLAEHRNGSYTPMKEVAARQEISLKYIEKLMPALKGAGLIESSHGIGGGYRLTREPEQYTRRATSRQCPACRKMRRYATAPRSVGRSRSGKTTTS